ncbi:MAG: ATP-binding protein [Firmicutes bacterium HGW-Firmicutes-7]|nr:MAG: ATP-binding protein [Firmicutes bacterium HGW-Firmicutes-7]
MLIQFNFSNFKSYLNETTLDLSSTNLSELKSNTINYKKNEEYLKAISIYGSNASGKSNVLDAFQQMKFWVLKSFVLSTERKVIPLKRFQFSEFGKNGNSLFEAFFTVDDKEYQYGYSLDEKSIQSEWLYKRNFKFKNKYELVFERENQKFNLSTKLNKTKDLISSMNEKTLLVTLLSSLKIDDAINVSKWFEDTEVINFGDTTFEFMVSRSLPKVDFLNEAEYKRFIDFLKAIDLGIQGVRIEKVDNVNEDMERNGERYKIYTQHRNIDNNDFEEIPLNDESSGTVKMISLYYFLNEALEKGKTLFVDEMDAKLHPLLTRYIINLFQDSDSNNNNAQLIFTTHDTNTLNKELFRRDQIWFAEKNDKGISELFSLAEYKINNAKIRKDASYNKDYLGGRYGAIPNLSLFKDGE